MNLNQLTKGMATYLTEHGDNRFYPCPLGRGHDPRGYNGAEWLASLYWTGIAPDPGLFLCPSTDDTNDRGRDIGTEKIAAGFGSQTVSYAAMHYRSTTDADGSDTRGEAIRDDFPPNAPMASDDTQGSINHGVEDMEGMCVLFFDSHVEFKSADDIDIERAVGDRGRRGDPRPLLWQLRN